MDTFKITVISATLKCQNINKSKDLYKPEFIENMKKILENQEKQENMKKFNNCEILKFSYKESKNISVKIFKNGSIQLTGLISLENLYDFTNEILFENKENIKINMINGTFKVKLNVDLNELLMKLSKFFYSVSYQPNRYHALKATHSNNTKLIVFNNGSCCCIGNDILNMNECIKDFIKFI